LTYEEFYQKLVSENLIKEYQEVIKTDTWSGGGSFGSCWDEDEDTPRQTSGEDPKKLVAFDKILEIICPKISFLKYKKLIKEEPNYDN